MTLFLHIYISYGRNIMIIIFVKKLQNSLIFSSVITFICNLPELLTLKEQKQPILSLTTFKLLYISFSLYLYLFSFTFFRNIFYDFSSLFMFLILLNTAFNYIRWLTFYLIVYLKRSLDSIWLPYFCVCFTSLFTSFIYKFTWINKYCYIYLSIFSPKNNYIHIYTYIFICIYIIIGFFICRVST